MSSPTAVQTAAAALFENPTVDAAIEQILGELRTAQAGLTGARGPLDDAHRETLQSWLDRLAPVKGRGALFPYVGSGVGHHALVELLDGSVKWDLINGIGVHMFGHSDLGMVEAALRAAMSDVVMQGNLQYNADAIAFMETVVEQASQDSHLRHAFITNSGAMANESALKVCFQRNQPACRVIAFEHCFMGRSTTMAQIGDSAGGRVGIPLNTHVDYLPFYEHHDPEGSSKRALTMLKNYVKRYPRQHAVFIMEPVQGEGGFNTATHEFFEPMLQVCKESRIAVWSDEVQTFGRTERMFHFQQLGLGEYVDVATIGKMSQVCAAVFTEQYNPKPGLLSGTFIGSTAGLRVGRQVLERMRDGGYYGPDGRNAQLHAAFRASAQKLIDANPAWFPAVHLEDGTESRDFVGGVGGMCRFTPFGGRKDLVTKLLHTLFDEGVIAFYCGHGPFHIRFLPPVGVMPIDRFDEVFEIVGRAMGRVAAEK